jgi:hypothetical protein
MDSPVSIIASSGDPILRVMDNAIPAALALPDAQLTLLSHRVGHYTFLTDCAPAGRRAFPAICADAGPARAAVHAAARELAVAFF